MSSDENNSNSNESDLIIWRERLKDFDEWHSQNMQQNNIIDDMVNHVLNATPNPFIQSTNSNPRACRRYYERSREQGHQHLFDDYFAESPVYPPHIFRRRFRIQKHVFLRIVDALTTTDAYFQQRPDATGRQGLSPLQKCTAAIRVLAYGTSADAVDEYLRVSSAVTRQSLMRFVEGIISNFGDEYLRRPNEEDLERLLSIGEQRGFPGMMGSIYCMHWEWKNCPTAWAGQYAGRSGKATIILEAVASYDLWIWHAFFGTPGSCNDINVLHRSPVFNDILEGRAPQVNYSVNSHQYNMGYYLTDGIYPPWAAFVKSINEPQIEMQKKFARHQEACRKDVERAFGVLQSRFAFIHRPCLIWNNRLMEKIMKACIIMHNMIVEDERDTYQNYFDTTEFTPIHFVGRTNMGNATEEENGDESLPISTQISSLSAYMNKRSQLCKRETHLALKNDLIQHIWEKVRVDSR